MHKDKIVQSYETSLRFILFHLQKNKASIAKSVAHLVVNNYIHIAYC